MMPPFAFSPSAASCARNEFAHLMRFEVKAVAFLRLGPIQLETFRRPSARMMIPAVGNQETTNVHE